MHSHTLSIPLSLLLLRLFPKKPMSIIFFFLFLFLTISGLSSTLALVLGNDLPNALQFELIHRHEVELSTPKTQLERVKEMVHNDNLRVQMITQRLGGERIRRKLKALEETPSRLNSAEFRMSSGAYRGIGEYLVQFRVGTPPKKFLLAADTGSDLTWMKCSYGCHNCSSRRFHRRRIFHADQSSSFKTIPCSTEMCKNLSFSLARCPSPISPCQYDYGYIDGSSAQGVFANETVTVCLTNGRKMKLNHIVVGCSTSAMGPTFRGLDGVLGLGYSNYSFTVKAIEKFGGKFSYCLVDHLSPRNVSSYLTFGEIHDKNYNARFEKMRYTQLILDVVTGYYPVNVLGISIGSVMLKIPSSNWDLNGEGGVIIDSGTSLTFLAQPAYQMVMTALRFPLMIFEEVHLKPFDFCFSSVGFDEALVPKLVIHFVDSARFEPHVKNYVIDVSKGVKCLGFMPTSSSDVSIIGNIMQQNFLWEFDIARKRLGFAASTCSSS